MQRFVSGVNCSPTTARDEMIAVKKAVRQGGRHRSLPRLPELCPRRGHPEMAHEIGLKLAKALWGEKYQVLVATHLDKAHHLHNHFVVNTVSFLDGIKYHRTEKDYFDMQRESDRLCREYGLSVIENPQRGKNPNTTGNGGPSRRAAPTYSPHQSRCRRCHPPVDDGEAVFFTACGRWATKSRWGKDITVRPYDRPHGRKLARNLGRGLRSGEHPQRILAQRRPQRVETPEPRRCRLLGT